MYMYNMTLFSVHWTVVNEGANQVRLHNNNNFLAIINGTTVIMHMVSGGTPQSLHNTVAGIRNRIHVKQLCFFQTKM